MFIQCVMHGTCFVVQNVSSVCFVLTIQVTFRNTMAHQTLNMSCFEVVCVWNMLGLVCKRNVMLFFFLWKIDCIAT